MSTVDENQIKITAGGNCSLLEPKEEPLDDFPSMSTENENSAMDQHNRTVATENLFNKLLSIMHDHSYCINRAVPQPESQKVLRVKKQSDTEMMCPECEYRTRNVYSWVDHLRKKHDTTPDLSDIAHFTANGGRSGELISTVKEEEPTPKCFLCDTCPKTVCGYMGHLRNHHKTTLRAHGFYIICSCGSIIRSHNFDRSHKEKCDGRQFKIYKQISEECQSSPMKPSEEPGDSKKKLLEPKEEPGKPKDESVENENPFKDVLLKGRQKQLRVKKQSDTEMKCPYCEYLTRDATTWMQHLRKQHSTSPAEAGFALLCECGHESQSSSHSNVCNIANFTVISKPQEAKKQLTPKCFLCDMHPKTVCGYTGHLRKHHKTTLNEHGIYIICACDSEIRSEHYSKSHKCNGRQFALSTQISEVGQSSLLEPKEEPVDTVNENSNRCEYSLLDETLFHNIPVDNEQSVMEDTVCKEEDMSEEEEAPTQFSIDFPHGSDNSDSESSEGSDNDDPGVSEEKAVQKSEKKNVSKRKSSSGGFPQSIPVKKACKDSATEIGCPECEYRTRSAGCWWMHLKSNHSTTPTLAGVALLCECGIESVSNGHSRVCDISNFTVVRKGDGPIKRLYDAKVTPQCLLCEKYPPTGNAYLFHLGKNHKSTLMANGIYLKCACGFKITCDSKPLRDHNATCRGREFTLHKIDEE